MFAVILVASLSFVAAQESYIECSPGNTNLIISSPHGGHQRPQHIPDRGDAGCKQDGKCVWRHDCGRQSFHRWAIRHFLRLTKRNNIVTISMAAAAAELTPATTCTRKNWRVWFENTSKRLLENGRSWSSTTWLAQNWTQIAKWNKRLLATKTLLAPGRNSIGNCWMLMEKNSYSQFRQWLVIIVQVYQWIKRTNYVGIRFRAFPGHSRPQSSQQLDWTRWQLQ